MAAAMEEDFTAADLEVAAILCDLRSILRARDRRRRQRDAARQEIPSWGRRRPRSMPEAEVEAEGKPAAPAPAPAATERDGVASPDTPLAYPESGGDDAPADEDDAKKPAAQEQWVQEQHGAVASLSQENAHLLKQIEEYRARLQSSRSTNASLKQLHKVRRHEQEQEQAKAAAVDPRSLAPGLNLNQPAPAPAPAPARAADEDEQQLALARARAAAQAADWYRQAHLRAALQKAAVTAGARRRRLEILRAKAACPLVSSRPRRVGRG